MTRVNVTQQFETGRKGRKQSLPKPGKSPCIAPHMIRHATAMSLLQSGVEINVIAIWLGPESPTTNQYVQANLELKERALAKLPAPDATLHRYRASDALIEFLKNL